jgi:hypothetical protein
VLRIFHDWAPTSTLNRSRMVTVLPSPAFTTLQWGSRSSGRVGVSATR